MRAVDGKTFVALAATSAKFHLEGGKYGLMFHINSASGLTAGLQGLSADGTNFVAIGTARAHVNGYEAQDIPEGDYEIVISGSAGAGESFDVSVVRVPGE